ncbi:hypothetical protein BDW02DRAFT_277017 [Decorospora gaudefroyi]|uniref:Uncharacterized protein n=1 Tax=Decorospora gaudefroyi TaxID=184978 RepID=A0A6A5KSD4_9PLEO|nr:hypothetical protein BDW02DRAFT_277017 [Decorospora gaudefroyi]
MSNSALPLMASADGICWSPSMRQFIRVANPPQGQQHLAMPTRTRGSFEALKNYPNRFFPIQCNSGMPQPMTPTGFAATNSNPAGFFPSQYSSPSGMPQPMDPTGFAATNSTPAGFFPSQYPSSSDIPQPSTPTGFAATNSFPFGSVNNQYQPQQQFVGTPQPFPNCPAASNSCSADLVPDLHPEGGMPQPSSTPLIPDDSILSGPEFAEVRQQLERMSQPRSNDFAADPNFALCESRELRGSPFDLGFPAEKHQFTDDGGEQFDLGQCIQDDPFMLPAPLVQQQGQPPQEKTGFIDLTGDETSGEEAGREAERERAPRNAVGSKRSREADEVVDEVEDRPKKRGRPCKKAEAEVAVVEEVNEYAPLEKRMVYGISAFLGYLHT